MGARPGRRLIRTRGAPRRTTGALLCALLAAPAALGAQEPARPDSLARDTLAADAPVQDTLARDTAAADTLPPLPARLPSFSDSVATGWTAGVWEWDRAALLREGAFTLTDLLERIPGVISIRAGFLLQDEAVSLLGGTVTPVEIVLDGFALDPLTAPTFDLSRLELLDLERVRVERRFDRLRVELETLAPTEREAVSILEIGTGDLDTNLFRGTLLAPRFLDNPLSVGFERLSTDGRGGAEGGSHTATWAKWGLVSGSAGVQLEIRRTSFQRENVTGTGGDGDRTDWVVRARGEPLDGLVTEAFVGHSASDVLLGEDRLRESSGQAGLRSRTGGPDGWIEGSVRVRTSPGLPGIGGRLAAGGRPLSWLRLRAAAEIAEWPGNETAASIHVRAETAPVLGIRPFAEVQSGDHGVPFYLEPDGDALLLDRQAARFGGELRIGGLALGAAGLIVDSDPMPTFGLAFDRTRELFPAGEFTGIELRGRLPTWWSTLWLEGWYADTPIDTGWIYTPEYSWYGALNLHTTPLESGNLELLARVQARGRGNMLVPTSAARPEALPEDPDDTVLVPRTTFYDVYVQVRIISFRLFIRWDNVGSDITRDLPGRPFPRQRLFTGIKWVFRN